MWMTSVSLLFHVSTDSKIILKIEMSYEKLNSQLLQPDTQPHFSYLCHDHVHPHMKFRIHRHIGSTYFLCHLKGTLSFPSKSEMDTAISMSELVQYNISFTAVRCDHKTSSCWYILL